MARQVARQFYRLREVHSLVYGLRAGSENGRRLTNSTHVDSQSRLMNYPGLNLLIGIRFDLGVVLVVSLLSFFRRDSGVIARGKF
ncbi:hypothetical protein SAMN05720354_10577 [Nitrosospira sp. Nsp1]|nr:hypothetical protein SAMN05720354_10577 [Nitrosospira sp. Nsp1]